MATHRHRQPTGQRIEPEGDARTDTGASVLADLPFALEPDDLERNADDGAEHLRKLSAARVVDLPVVRVTGYQTDTAFNRAIRREYGMPPAAWRRLPMSDNSLPRAYGNRQLSGAP